MAVKLLADTFEYAKGAMDPAPLPPVVTVVPNSVNGPVPGFVDTRAKYGVPGFKPKKRAKVFAVVELWFAGKVFGKPPVDNSAV